MTYQPAVRRLQGGNTLQLVSGATLDIDEAAAVDSVLRVAAFTFDAGVAANRTIAPHGTGITLPANAIVVGGFVDVNTAFTSASTNTGTIAISVEGADDIVAAVAVSGAPYSTIGRKAIVPKANTPESTAVKASVAREITCTVAVAALLTGKLSGYLYWIPGVASA